MIGGTGCALTVHSRHSFSFSAADLERGREGGLVLLLVGRRCVGGLRRDGQALAYKAERETAL